ncbi:ZZ-type zinc finger-containing protein 3 [Drosophila subobscura]|uniref:ZZ-type zinc finger-containing protein 3 n=1 Tax=Drosophila subobscura TaxID=7241 RepID=UPI00155A114E|nr:ZZ-type zinc finger-containing protein 3 [Drosophila subobscura]
MEQLEDSAPEDENVFHFESEHLALRGNECYASLLRTIAVLQAQRIRVHQQIDELEASRKMYLNNPQLLLDKLSSNEPLISDNYIAIAPLPELPTLMAKAVDGGEVDFKLPTSQMASYTPQSSLPPSPETSNVSSSERSTKHQNRLWTNEEQRHLEQLLIKYPPEEVESRRFAKIAKALGNRTTQQVFSRIQKYFQKLHEAGMPVPGRLPKYRRTTHTKPKFNIRRSTFFPAQNISLQMPEDDMTLDELRGLSPAGSLSPAAPRVKLEPKAETDSLDGELDKEAKRKEQLRLKLLTAVLEEKQQIEAGYNPDPLAPKCAECEAASVTRTNWRCDSCYCHLNLCGDCLAGQLIEERFEHLGHEVVVDEDS